jgi:hypothetical protein
VARSKRIIAADCETDPFKYDRTPEPFIWGTYDGSAYRTFNSTDNFVSWVHTQGDVVIYAHNGGKFDFMFLLKYVKETRAQIINGRIVKMMLGKAELRDSYAAVPEALGKIGKKEIDYSKLEKAVRHLHMPEIIEYLEVDCVTLYNLITEYRKIAGTQLTIASNALKFSKKLGVNPGKTNAHFDGLLRDFYFGGRTECFRPGTHRNIDILDIRSSYPNAMCKNHASGDERTHLETWQFEELSREEKQKCFIKLDATTISGCFPKRAKSGGLDFPIGENSFAVTGWEYIAAKELGLFKDEKIQDVISFTNEINFKPYIDHWFAYKASFDKKINPIQYTIGKIMMNSLYGKLAQNPARYFDYVIVPGGTPVNNKEGWEIVEEYQNIEIHRREALWKYKFQFGVEWKGRPLYNNVATGASITGFARAHLLKAIHTVGEKHVIYCDTDSIICAPGANYKALPMSEAIGDWAHEGTGSIGHFCGKKLYAIRIPGEKDKIASKGSKLTFEDMEQIAKGNSVVWRNEAPSFSIAGTSSFVVRSIRSTANKPMENANQ